MWPRRRLASPHLPPAGWLLGRSTGPGIECHDVGRAVAAVRRGMAAECPGHHRTDRERHRYVRERAGRRVPRAPEEERGTPGWSRGTRDPRDRPVGAQSPSCPGLGTDCPPAGTAEDAELSCPATRSRTSQPVRALCVALAPRDLPTLVVSPSVACWGILPAPRNTPYPQQFYPSACGVRRRAGSEKQPELGEV